MLVLGFDLNLIISQKIVHERKYFATCTLIDNMINKQGWKIVFQARFFQIVETHTNVNHALLLVDMNQARYPFHQLYRVDETNFEEFLYLSLYCRCFLRIDWENILSDHFDIKTIHDFVFNNSWIDA
jgi:hypothetical protein